MDKFIEENIEKKAILLGFKKLKKKISTELVKHSRKFGERSKGILIMGINHTHLILEVLERNLDMDNILDVNLDFVDAGNSKISIWGIPIYVIQEDNVIIIVNSLGEVYENPSAANFWEIAGGNNLVKELNTLIEELPDHSKLRRVSSEGV